MNKQQEPRLRFKGFTGEWEDKKLGELILYLKGFAFKTENYKNSGIRIIRGLDLSAHSIKNNTDSVFIAISEYTKYQDWEIQENDIIVTTVGSKPHLIDSAVGRAIFVDKEKIGLLNQNLLILRNIEKETNSFIYANLLTQKFYKYIESIQRGNANQSNITVNDLLDFSLFCPPHKEQTTIGNFFRRLDSQIAESRAVLEKNRQLKKAMLAKMFPANGEKIPKIRFKGFEGEWESRKLGAEVEIVGGGTPDTTNSTYWNGDIDWYSPTEIGETAYANGSVKKITLLGLQKSSAQILPANRTVLFTSRASIGDMAILTKDGATNQGFQSFVVREKLDVYFLYTMGFKIKDYALKNASGSTFLEISKNTLSQMEFFVPSLKEQTQIGNFFRQLDETIALQSAEVEKLNQLKKGLLAAMLV